MSCWSSPLFIARDRACPPLFRGHSLDRRPKQRDWRSLLRATSSNSLLRLLVLLGLAVLYYMLHPIVEEKLQKAFRQIYYGLDPRMLGRRDEEFPVTRCCESSACLVQGREPRHAVISYIRTDAYFPLLQQLECTLRKSNPWVELAVILVRGELSEGVLRSIQGMNITIHYMESLAYPNKYNARFSGNWLKIRAFGLTQYDAFVLLDSDAIVIGDLQPLFNLPTDFAASWNQAKWKNKYKTMVDGINGGMLFIRPCKVTQDHMLGILEREPKLRFTYAAAEQDFLTWYFRYTLMMLPLEWNTMASESMDRGRTIGGLKPRIVHLTEDKPFNGPQPEAPGHEYLCSSASLRPT